LAAVAPIVRFNALEILPTPAFFFANDFRSRTSDEISLAIHFWSRLKSHRSGAGNQLHLPSILPSLGYYSRFVDSLHELGGRLNLRARARKLTDWNL